MPTGSFSPISRLQNAGPQLEKEKYATRRLPTRHSDKDEMGRLRKTTVPSESALHGWPKEDSGPRTHRRTWPGPGGSLRVSVSLGLSHARSFSGAGPGVCSPARRQLSSALVTHRGAWKERVKITERSRPPEAREAAPGKAGSVGLACVRGQGRLGGGERGPGFAVAAAVRVGKGTAPGCSAERQGRGSRPARSLSAPRSGGVEADRRPGSAPPRALATSRARVRDLAMLAEAVGRDSGQRSICKTCSVVSTPEAYMWIIGIQRQTVPEEMFVMAST
ncbi:uncharacterized protein [Marmota flaviventris]|uniref:uncharacterized protein n=1 Tax=Marmota flaviventris TaxID=93162 RepID=UPI003A89FE07